jgi:sugar/nucleoside kinase (ribokinase family)
MTEPAKDVVAIGNAIVDVIARCDDEFLDAQGLDKGAMRLIGAEEADALYAAMGPAVEISGGSAANTVAGVASLGGRAGFIGRVADDAFGGVFRHDINAIGVDYATPPAKGGAPTARCLVLVTPDGERTMSTFLGASVGLGPADIVTSDIENAAILYLEGYLFDPPEAREAFHRAARIAKGAGRRVALTLSDSFCVTRHREAFRAFIAQGVDILFANEHEALALYETDDFEAAAAAAAKDCEIAAITRSALGSVVASGASRVAVPAHPVASVVDATGAGDLYAAGFLLAQARGATLAQSARLASLSAAEIISHLGARPDVSLEKLAARDPDLAGIVGLAPSHAGS